MTLDELYTAFLQGDRTAGRCVWLMAEWGRTGDRMLMKDAMELRDLIHDLDVDLHTTFTIRDRGSDQDGTEDSVHDRAMVSRDIDRPETG